MQTKSLRQAATHYLQNNRTGSLPDKKQRRYVIHKLIDDLFYLGDVPATWDTLPPERIHKLVALWKKRKIKLATIMNHMVIIREFLRSMDCDTYMLTNQNLGLTKKPKNKKQLKVNAHKNLIESHGYDAVRFMWREALRALNLPEQKTYRYVYAHLRQKALFTTLTHYKTTLTIMDEMGIKSRTTLWGYLHGEP